MTSTSDDFSATLKEPEFYIGVLDSGAVSMNGVIQIDESEWLTLFEESNRVVLFMQQQSFTLVQRNFAAVNATFAVGRSAHITTSPTSVQPIYEELRFNVLNWLLSTRLFLDHTHHDIVSKFGETSTQKATWDAARRKEHSEHVGYRVMYCLRDYISHRGLPPLSLRAAVHLSGGREFSVKLQPAALLATSFNWKRARDDLLLMGPEVDIEPLANDYMDCLERLAGVAHELLAPNLLDGATRILAAAGRVSGYAGVPSLLRYEATKDQRIEVVPCPLPVALAERLVTQFSTTST